MKAGLVDFHQAPTGCARGRPCSACGRAAKRCGKTDTSFLQGRDAVGVGRHQVGGQNQTVSGSRRAGFPAVTEVCRRQPAHSKVCAFLRSAHPFSWPHAGQTKPSGQNAFRSARRRRRHRPGTCCRGPVSCWLRRPYSEHYPFPRPNLNLNIWWQTLATGAMCISGLMNIGQIPVLPKKDQPKTQRKARFRQYLP